MRNYLGVLLLALWLAIATATPLSACLPAQPEICFGVAVPADTADSGSGDVYLRIRAPTSMAWVALGTGSGMSDASIFVMYRDGSGNVTLSPRLGEGHQEPRPSEVEVIRLSGSGVEDGVMVGEFRCVGCASWTSANGDTQILEFGDGSESGFISAWKEGELESSDEGVHISYHDGRAVFTLTLANAIFDAATDVNPFENNGPNTIDDAFMGGSGSTDGMARINPSARTHPPRLVAHGAIMSVVFVLMYPAGAILQPLLKIWYVHAGWQVTAFVLMWVGFGLGYTIAKDFGMLFKGTHTILGTVVCALMIVQLALGYMHHRHFAQYRRRSIWSHAHMNFGRALMVLGIINGGIGLRLAHAPRAAVTAYAIVAAGMGVTYTFISVLSEIKRRRVQRQAANEGDGGDGIRLQKK